ncbi:ROK family transcriptional regulator [Deinococcus roseus]|uniref:Transcriptional regulator n=1 Tax=Deinococcus roseus TaxID=392414 RepID=A0ABQ2DD34_9DEIO|nr:ROK family protein [Deinococcus roseus]GGJ52523.1 transcriptional regulator [Deinococcus roseus]
MTLSSDSIPAREKVYHALKTAPGTRPELAQRTGLSVVSVIAAVDELIACELARLQETPPPSGRGRPAARVGLRLDTTITALDLGAPQVLAGRFNLLGGFQEGSETRTHGTAFSRFSEDPEHNVQLLQAWLQEQGSANLSVISVLGAVHPRTRILSSHPLGMKEYPLEKDLSERLGWPVLVENDANLSAWHSWHTLGLAKEDPLVFLNYSHGIGLGMVLGGKVYHGATGAAGEVSYAADPAKRGRHDILARRLIRHLHSAIPGSTTAEVAAVAVQGDRSALKALKLFNQDLANHLTAVAAVLDPAVMVLQDVPHAADPLQKELQKALSELDLHPRVMVSPLGPMGGLYSAAHYGAHILEQQKLRGEMP